MAWTSLLVNPEGLRSIYGVEGPSLAGVRLVECFRTTGRILKSASISPSIQLILHGNGRRGCNTVQVELGFLSVREIELERFGVENIVDVDLEVDDGVRFSASAVLGAPGIHLRGVADSLYLSKVSAYLNEV